MVIKLNKYVLIWMVLGAFVLCALTGIVNMDKCRMVSACFDWFACGITAALAFFIWGNWEDM